MKKKIIMLVLLSVLLTGCSYAGSKNYTEPIDRCLLPTTKQNLYYDSSTKIVYMIFNEIVGHSMSPYYAPNGLPYIYNPETNELEEIN